MSDVEENGEQIPDDLPDIQNDLSAIQITETKEKGHENPAHTDKPPDEGDSKMNNKKMGLKKPKPLKRPLSEISKDPVALHLSLMEKVKKELSQNVWTNDVNNVTLSGILNAKVAEYQELDLQLTTYRTVTARTDDPKLLGREKYRFINRLPAFAKRLEVDEFIDEFTSENRFLIVQGETGSGKSTQLPQYLVDHPKMAGKKIICTQPRKLAAVSLADRVGLEYACGDKKRVGLTVGYSIGGSRARISKTKTRIEYMTEGRMLERVMNRSPEDFANIGAIILDEAHERSITCDILLGTLKKNDPLWEDILIVVSSATIDLEAFAKFFQYKAKIVKIAGRMYPVERVFKPLPEEKISYSNLGENGDIIKAAAETALEIHSSPETGPGDILCFLPGAEEVHRSAVYFEKHVKKENNGKKLLTPKIYELTGRLEADEQRRVFEELNPTIYRKVIFASPIAETSITINGVVHVVDSGYKKEMTFDTQRNISALKTVFISRSNSLQREGRAGRTQPGVCYKLYSEEDFLKMSANTLPEILCRPLPLAIIYLRRMGVDPVAFDWISAPAPETIKAAEDELIILGALDGDAKLPTELGNLISTSQQDPKTVRMIYTGMRKGAGIVAIKVAALASVSNMFFYYAKKDAEQSVKDKITETRISVSNKDSDILTMFKLFSEYESLEKVKQVQMEWLKSHTLSPKGIKTAESTIHDLTHSFKSSDLWNELSPTQSLDQTDEEILKLFCSGYFLNAARWIKLPGRNRDLNYFALESEVVGCISFRASIASRKEGNPPDWIVYDQILKLPNVTLYPVTSKIELKWIKEENELFYMQCLAKQENLQTEVIEINESGSVFRSIFGRRMVNLPNFENSLNCCIDVDLNSGVLRAFSSKVCKNRVESALKSEVEQAKKLIRGETFEELWMGNTRLVLGCGYEVAIVLFSGEYNTVALHSKSFSPEDFENVIFSKVNKNLNLQFFHRGHSSSVEVKHFNVKDAFLFYNEMRDLFKDSSIGVAPCLGENARRGATPKPEEVRLKITWALGPPTGEAKIVLDSARDGNKVIDMLPMLMSGVTTHTCGDDNLQDFTGGFKVKTYKIERGKWHFVENIIYLTPAMFKVKIKNMGTAFDELKIQHLLKSISVNPLSVIVSREEIPNDVGKRSVAPNVKDLQEMERKVKMKPLLEILGEKRNLHANSFEDKRANRAGMLVHYPDSKILTDSFGEIQEKYGAWMSHFHPHRVELERLFTFSVFIDLYECLKQNFKDAIVEIKRLGIRIFESGNKKDLVRRSRFVHIKYQATDKDMMWRCRRILEKALNWDSLDGKTTPNFENLFTWTGRDLVKEEIPTATEDYYLHWNIQLQCVHIYGADSGKRKDVALRLKEVIDRIEKWKKADCFELPIMMCKKRLKEMDKKYSEFIESSCRVYNFSKGQYRLLGKNRLVVSASSKGQIELLRKYLDSKGVLMPERANRQSAVRDCGVCFCEVDPKCIVTSLCNHPFCLECIQNMFSGVAEGTNIQKLPLCCPYEDCDEKFAVEDIKKIVPPSAMTKLNELALGSYMDTEIGKLLKSCPKPGCCQIFRPKDESDSTFFTCDSCHSDFCVKCSEALEKEVGAHPGLRCEDVQANADDVLRKLINQVRDEILNLHCGNCKKSFLDYFGCAALTCSKCEAGICALCLQVCGRDAHSHVFSCRFNTKSLGGVFVDKDVVVEANRLVRIEKLKEFFLNSPELKSSPVENVRFKLLGALARDLSDLGIQANEIMRECKIQPS